MGKVKEGISQGFQWHLKWVRVMFGASIIAIVAVLLFPTAKKAAIPQVILYSLDSLQKNNASHFRFDSAGIDTTEYKQMKETSGKGMNKSVERYKTKAHPTQKANLNKSASPTTPIQVQIVEPVKPFDWKGTVTWLIGAINGLILVALNIKNLIIKKRPI